MLTIATGRAHARRAAAFDLGSGLPVVGNFNPVTLNGTTQLTSATIAPFVIIDDSGTLAGWHVTLLVPDFRNGTGAGCATGATASISGANLSMNAPVVTAADADTDMTGVSRPGFSDFTTAARSSPRPRATAPGPTTSRRRSCASPFPPT